MDEKRTIDSDKLSSPLKCTSIQVDLSLQEGNTNDCEESNLYEKRTIVSEKNSNIQIDKRLSEKNADCKDSSLHEKTSLLLPGTVEGNQPKEDVKSRTTVLQNRKWLCVVGCAIAHFVLGGFERSNGVLYLHIQQRFGAGASDIAWVISLSVTLKLLFGPVASILCTKFSPRCVVITGAILFSMGVLLTAYLPRFVMLYISYGVMSGIGKSLAYQPGLVVVGQHFAKRRGRAVGLATAGGGIGTLCLPPLFEFLMTCYGFSGGVLILSGVALQMCISGMLYKAPPEDNKLQNQPLISHSCERVHKSIQLNEMPEISEVHTMEIQKPKSSKGYKYCQKLWLSRCFPSCNTVKNENTTTTKKFDITLLRKPDFVMFCLGIGFLALSFNSMLVFIPPLADSRGLTGVQGAYIMSVAGVFDTIGRIASGFILDLKRLRKVRKIIYNVVMFLLSFIIFSLPFVVTFVEFCTVAAIFGLLIGTYTSQKSVILVDVVGSEKLNSSFGILIFFQGVGTLLGPPLTGIFKDIYNSYGDGFYFIGGTTFLGAVILLLSNTIKCSRK